MIPNIPEFLPMPFAQNGQKNEIAESISDATLPNASWSGGFPPITTTNKQAGGKPPLGEDFNGVFNAITEHTYFQQSGGVYPWQATLNYIAGCRILGSDGNEYVAVAPSGPDVPGTSGNVGPQDPTGADAGAYWQLFAAGSGRNPGELVFSLLPLEDAGLHLLDGSLLAADGMYAEFVELLAGLRGAHPGLFITESQWQAAVADYGACGKFVYDEAAATLRLPKVTGFIEGTLDAAALGDLTEAGLPNITGSQTFRPAMADNGSVANSVLGADGAFHQSGLQESPSPASSLLYGTTVNNYSRTSFDASRSSPVYGNSVTVQPQSIKGYIYITVAGSVRNPAEVDAAKYADDLALKADKSLANVTAAGAAAMAHAAMPSSSTINLSIPAASGDVITAPADGYVILRGLSTTLPGYLELVGSGGINVLSWSGASGSATAVYIPVRKGASVTVRFTNHSIVSFRLTYCQGSLSA